MWNSILCYFKSFLNELKKQSISQIDFELNEMENGFALLSFGSFMGMPSSPSFLGMALLPYIEREIDIMLHRSSGLDDRFASKLCCATRITVKGSH